MFKLFAAIIAVAVVGYAAIVCYFLLMQKRLVFPATREALLSADRLSPAFRTVKIPTYDGLSLTAWYHPPPGGGPVILYFHGNAGTLNARAARFRAFAEMGYGVLAPEYRGYGENPGHPSAGAFLHDALSAYDVLCKANVEPSQIIVMGESLGTHFATQVARRRKVRALVLDSPFTSIAAAGAARYPYLPVSALIRDRMDTLALIEHLDVPLLVLFSHRDRTVPPVQEQAVFDHAPQPKTLFSTPNGTHATVLENGGFAGMQDFISALWSRKVGADGAASN